TATGTVTFFDGATSLGTRSLASGSASLTTTTLSGGNHAVKVIYTTDGNFTSSTSSTWTQTVNPAASTTTISSNPNPSVIGQSVSFTAIVTGTGATPAGTVTFFEGGTSIGSATLTGGLASLSTATLSVGSHSITIIYSGDTNFVASTSGT